MMYTWEERKKFYSRDYFDGELPGHYREWWWTADVVWQPRAQIIKDALAPNTVMVCGCAKGSLVKYLMDVGIKAVGFDLSEYAISTTPFPEMHGRLLHHDLACYPLPYLDRHFGLTTAFDFIEHQDDQHIEFVCSEISRITRTYILIRQPFIDRASIPDLQATYDSTVGMPLDKRLLYIYELGAIPPLVDSENIEHPNARSRDGTLALFPEFREIPILPEYYDIGPEIEPILPFFDTMLLKRDS